MQAQAGSPRIESQPGPSATNTAQTNQRPTMRRKSSAQNLLASFKPNSNSNANNNSSPSSAVPTPSPSPIPIPVPPQPSSAAPMQTSLGGPGQASSSVASSFSFASTPTAYTPIQKEWDSQSMHSDGANQPPQTASNSTFSQGATVEYLRDLVQKRIITLTYMRNVHDGCVPCALRSGQSGILTCTQTKSLVSHNHDVAPRARQSVQQRCHEEEVSSITPLPCSPLYPEIHMHGK